MGVVIIAVKKVMGEIILNIVWVIIAAVFYWLAIPYASVRTFDPLGPHVFPQIVSVVIIVCAVVNLFMIFLRMREDRSITVDAKGVQQAEGSDFQNFLKVALIVLISGVYILILNWIGYLLSTILLVFLLILIQGGTGFSKNLAVSCGFSLVLYILFSRVLKIILPESLLKFLFT
ncbi:MAG: tripartite tricarboxylate transporter TctB family protein [Synergistota bacterium]|nr:tripartite tricarboxylate transporter TctB family protein [Synergistota bacterium]